VTLPFELFLALRYLRPKRTFVSVITLLSVMGVTLGVMVLIVVTSVMSGFQRDLREKVLGFNSHLSIGNGGIVEDPGAVMNTVAQCPGVVGYGPFVTGPVLVEFENRISTPFIRGVDPVREDSMLGLKRYLKDGEFLLQGEGVMVGWRFAERNGIGVGDTLRVFSARHMDEMRAAASEGRKVEALPTEYIVTGIFATGMFDYDSNFILTALDAAQELYKLEGGVHGVAVRLADPMRAVVAKDWLNQRLEAPLAAQTWMDMNTQLFSAVAIERNVMFFLLFFIIMVAAFGLTSTLITITVQKSREIGIMKATGATPGQVMRVFVLHGLVVGVVGALLGLGAGLFLVKFRNEAAQLLSSALHVEIFPASIYNFARIPAVVAPGEIALTVFLAVAVCVLAALLPAWQAARLHPAQAMRYE
jgi:lipoprotein-releasing system permease protein